MRLHSAEEWGRDHTRGDQGFLQREGGSLSAPQLTVLCSSPPDPRFSLPTTPPTVPSPNPMIPTQPHALSPSGLQISHFKIPRYIVFVTSYPLTISGKVCKMEQTREGQDSLGPGHRRPGGPNSAPGMGKSMAVG